MRWRAEPFGPVQAWWIDVVLGGVLTLAAVSPSAAQGHNTSTFVNTNHHECVGVPGCVSDVKPPVAVPARGRTQTRFACPESQPQLWGWDVGQHEHISVQLTAVNRSSATLVATNHADVEGFFVVYLGCSTTPYAGSVLQDSRYLAPTGWVPGTSLRTPDVTGDPRKQQSAPPGHECDGVPLCQVLGTYQFELTGWESRLIHYTCQGEYPYATFNYSYSQTGLYSCTDTLGLIYCQQCPG